MTKGLITAIRTLTILPVPGKDSDDFGATLPWFPLVGFLLGGLLYGLSFLWLKLSWLHWPEGGALLLVFGQLFLTRSLHLDGLADWADSFGGQDQPRRLAIMKDSNIGAFGALSLVFILIAKWVFFSRMLALEMTVWIMIIMTISRTMMVTWITGLPYARPGQGGMAQPFIQGASASRKYRAYAILIVISFFFGPAGPVLCGLGWIIARILAAGYKKSFGGVTGDLLGAGNELIEVALFFICAFSGRALQNYLSWSRWI